MVKYGSTKPNPEPNWIAKQYQSQQPIFMSRVIWYVICDYCVDKPLKFWTTKNVTHPDPFLAWVSKHATTQFSIGSFVMSNNQSLSNCLDRNNVSRTDSPLFCESYTVHLVKERSHPILFNWEVQLSIICNIPATLIDYNSTFQIQPLGSHADTSKCKIDLYWNKTECWWRYGALHIYNRKWRKIHGFNEQCRKADHTAIDFYISSEFDNFDKKQTFQLTFRSNSILLK